MKRQMRLETVGDLIREQRKARQLSQLALAQAADVLQSNLSRVEAGRIQQPDPVLLGQVAEALGVNVGLYYAAVGYPLPYQHLFPDPRAFFRSSYGIQPTASNIQQLAERVSRDLDHYLEQLARFQQSAIEHERDLGIAGNVPWPLASRSEVVLYEWFGLLRALELGRDGRDSPEAANGFGERLQIFKQIPG